MPDETADINYKELEPVDPDGPGAGPESDYEVVADYPTEAIQIEGDPTNA